MWVTSSPKRKFARWVSQDPVHNVPVRGAQEHRRANPEASTNQIQAQRPAEARAHDYVGLEGGERLALKLEALLVVVHEAPGRRAVRHGNAEAVLEPLRQITGLEAVRAELDDLRQAILDSTAPASGLLEHGRQPS